MILKNVPYVLHFCFVHFFPEMSSFCNLCSVFCWKKTLYQEFCDMVFLGLYLVLYMHIRHSTYDSFLVISPVSVVCSYSDSALCSGLKDRMLLHLDDAAESLSNGSEAFKKPSNDWNTLSVLSDFCDLFVVQWRNAETYCSASLHDIPSHQLVCSGCLCGRWKHGGRN